MKPSHKKFIEENIGIKSVEEIARTLGLRERNVSKYIKSKGLEEKRRREKADIPEQIENVAAPKKLFHAILIALIFIMAFFVYSSTLGNDFIWDDEFLVRDNTYIRSFTHLTDIFKSYLASSSGNINNFYRPMQELSYMVDYFLWGTEPFGFHLTNILLHALCAVLVYILSYKITRKIYAAFASGAIFAVHAINTEAVSYVAGRADSLYLLFFLASFIFFIKTGESFRADKTISIRFFSSSLACYFFALLSKEIALILPLLLALYVFSLYPNRAYKNKMYILCLWFCAVLFLYIVMRSALVKFSDLAPVSYMGRFNIFQRLFTTFKALCIYMGLIVFPVGLHMERTVKIAVNIIEPGAMLAALCVAAMIFTSIKSYKYSRIVFFGLLWFLLGLIPVSNIIPINSFIAEHWLYMPAIGIYMIAGLGLERIFEQKTGWREGLFFKVSSLGLCVFILLFYSYLTVQRNKDWKDEVSFFKNTLKYSPNNARLHLNFGNTYAELGRNEEALKEYEEAIRINPNSAEAYSNIGSVYLERGDFEGAKTYIDRALSLKPHFPNALHMSGMIYESQSRYREAEDAYMKALEVMPDNIPCRFRLADMYQRNGDVEKARYQLEKILQIKPNNEEAQQMLQYLPQKIDSQ